MINITFPDGNIRQYAAGTTSLDVAKSISEGLARVVLAASVNGEVRDLSRPIDSDATITFHKWEDKEGKQTFWHSSAHLLAEAIEALHPGTKFGIGPAIDNGFYYDIDSGDKPLTFADLPAIEQKVLELARQKSEYTRSEVSKADAIRYFTEKGDEYKLELIDGLQDGQITFYQQGNFTDLCKGPHIPSTETIKAVKILNLAGAYWRGDIERNQLTRVYAITFPKQKELELFMFSEKVGSGLPLWLPKGTAVRQRLEDFLKKEQIKRGYQPVITPHIGSKKLYMTSGHWEKYGKDSFQPIMTPQEGEEFMLKPMNCPHHCEIYGHRPRSYRELPVRIAEFGTVYRYEMSGELHGLTRVRGFTQDDAHIFCTEDQVKDEFLGALDLTRFVLAKLGFDTFTAQISLRDPHDKAKYIGTDESWEKAEKAIIDAAAEVGLKTTTALGEAAFYGPKLDFMVKDALGRSWQLGTIQVDYNLPERFNLKYIGADNAEHQPVMIHRAPFGSMERFMGVLIENCAGKFPLWLSPEQFAILPVSDKFVEYSYQVKQALEAEDLRGVVDDRNETIGRKIRDNELKRIPFLLIVGEKEVEAGTVSVRKQGEGDQGVVSIAAFAEMVKGML